MKRKTGICAILSLIVSVQSLFLVGAERRIIGPAGAALRRYLARQRPKPPFPTRPRIPRRILEEEARAAAAAELVAPPKVPFPPYEPRVPKPFEPFKGIEQVRFPKPVPRERTIEELDKRIDALDTSKYYKSIQLSETISEPQRKRLNREINELESKIRQLEAERFRLKLFERAEQEAVLKKERVTLSQMGTRIYDLEKEITGAEASWGAWARRGLGIEEPQELKDLRALKEELETKREAREQWLTEFYNNQLNTAFEEVIEAIKNIPSDLPIETIRSRALTEYERTFEEKDKYLINISRDPDERDLYIFTVVDFRSTPAFKELDNFIYKDGPLPTWFRRKVEPKPVTEEVKPIEPYVTRVGPKALPRFIPRAMRTKMHQWFYQMHKSLPKEERKKIRAYVYEQTGKELTERAITKGLPPDVIKASMDFLRQQTFVPVPTRPIALTGPQTMQVEQMIRNIKPPEFVPIPRIPKERALVPVRPEERHLVLATQFTSGPVSPSFIQQVQRGELKPFALLEIRPPKPGALIVPGEPLADVTLYLRNPVTGEVLKFFIDTKRIAPHYRALLEPIVKTRRAADIALFTRRALPIDVPAGVRWSELTLEQTSTAIKSFMNFIGKNPIVGYIFEQITAPLVKEEAPVSLEAPEKPSIIEGPKEAVGPPAVKPAIEEVKEPVTPIKPTVKPEITEVPTIEKPLIKPLPTPVVPPIKKLPIKELPPARPPVVVPPIEPVRPPVKPIPPVKRPPPKIVVTPPVNRLLELLEKYAQQILTALTDDQFIDESIINEFRTVAIDFADLLETYNDQLTLVRTIEQSEEQLALDENKKILTSIKQLIIDFITTHLGKEVVDRILESV